MKTLKILGAAALLSSSLSYAEVSKGGLFVEPMLTYQTGEHEINYPNPLGDSDGDIDGFGVGARVGFHVWESVFLGADGRYSMLNFKDSSADQDTDAKAFDYGPTVGFQTPTTLGIRVWGTYIMGGELDPDKDQGLDVKFKDGTGYRIGAGIKLGIASLNLEYQMMTYDKTDVDSVGPFNTNARFGNVELENSTWIASVSFPFSL